MPKFVIDLWLDGYDTEEEVKEACIEFIKESLDFSASSVEVFNIEDDEEPLKEGKTIKLLGKA